MPPPKLNLNKKTSGKYKPTIQKTNVVSPQNVIRNNQPQPSTSSGTDSTQSSSSLEEQFELELYWCVQQLEVTLQTGKLNPKQSKKN